MNWKDWNCSFDFLKWDNSCVWKGVTFHIRLFFLNSNPLPRISEIPREYHADKILEIPSCVIRMLGVDFLSHLSLSNSHQLIFFENVVFSNLTQQMNKSKLFLRNSLGNNSLWTQSSEALKATPCAITQIGLKVKELVSILFTYKRIVDTC